LIFQEIQKPFFRLPHIFPHTSYRIGAAVDGHARTVQARERCFPLARLHRASMRRMTSSSSISASNSRVKIRSTAAL